METSRRTFGKTIFGSLFAYAILGTAFVTGCSAESIAAAIIASFGQVLNLLKNAGVPTNNVLIEAAQAALSAFSSAYDAYQAAKSQGNLAALEAAAQSALSSVQAFLQETNIGGPIAQVAVALLEIILSTLASFLPSTAPNSAMRINGQTTAIVPVKRTRKQFVSAFNQACVANGHSELKIR